MTIVELAELGMLYRKVYNYVRVAHASAGALVGAGGMTEQVRTQLFQYSPQKLVLTLYKLNRVFALSFRKS